MAILKLNPVERVIIGENLIAGEVGSSIQEVFIVETEPGQEIFDALDIVNIPRVSDPHRKIPGFFYTEIDVEHESGSQNLYRITTTASSIHKSFHPASAADVSIGSTVQDVELAITLDGKVIQVWYTADRGETDPEKQPVSITVPRPFVTLTAVQAESFPPLQKSLENVGALNQNTFFGFEQGSWLCSRIDVDTVAQGRSNIVSYEFILNRAKWWPQIVFRDKTTKEVPRDVGEESFSGVNNGDPLFDFEGNNKNGLRIMEKAGSIFEVKPFEELGVRWPFGYNAFET